MKHIFEEDLEGCEIHLDIGARVYPTDFVVLLLQTTQMEKVELVEIAIDVNLQHEYA